MSAPTTAEVREMLEGESLSVLDEVLSVAEHRDALAAEVARLKAQVRDVCEANREDVDGLTAMVEQERAEVARLRADIEMFQRSASQAEQTRRDLAAEVARLRKLFDDAGEGTYDVLALVDHYQADAMRMSAEVARLREALAIACDWWGGCGHHYDDCPVDDAGELVETECAEARRVDELAAKGAGR